MNIQFITEIQLFNDYLKIQNITFKLDESLDKILKHLGNRKTTLTEWMETNKSNNVAKELSYIKYPNKWPGLE